MTTSSSSLPRQIYVRTPTWVGDVLMVTPALRALRRAHPDAHITAAGPSWFPTLFGDSDLVDEVTTESARSFGEQLRYARELRMRSYDWAVLFPDSLRTAIAPWIARIPLRVGYARDPLRRFALTEALDPPNQYGQRVPISMLERYLRITRAVGCGDAGLELEVPIRADAQAAVRKRLAAHGIAQGVPVAVVSPGASFGASKLWPVEHFAAASDALRERFGLYPVLTPGPGEEEIAREIVRHAKSPITLFDDPVTTLPELVALVDSAALLLCNDTGPRHIAVARQRPVVTLMGPTDPRHTEHLMERQRVLREHVDCSPCHLKVCPIDHRCMVRLRPERVIEAVSELLE